MHEAIASRDIERLAQGKFPTPASFFTTEENHLIATMRELLGNSLPDKSRAACDADDHVFFIGLGSTDLMCRHLGKNIENDHPSDDHRKANNRSEIEVLLEIEPAYQSDKGGSCARPNCIGHADRDGLERECER